MLLVACDADPFGTLGSASTATFSQVRTTILSPKCEKCHASDDSDGGVSVSTYDDLMSSAGAVVPYQPYQSQLYAQCASGEMPDDGPKLSQSELQLIYTWIALGAHND